MVHHHTKHSKAGKNRLPGPLPQMLNWAGGKPLQSLLKRG